MIDLSKLNIGDNIRVTFTIYYYDGKLTLEKIFKINSLQICDDSAKIASDYDVLTLRGENLEIGSLGALKDILESAGFSYKLSKVEKVN